MPNQIAWKYTKGIDPENAVIASETRLCRLTWESDAFRVRVRSTW
jgi:hypothetical protein